ncbi:MAG: iron ABC transporter permease [Alphaproteobacteria bacterium]|nr:iron ABC transporter permease [Alphaproteobacteria bacterium]
MSGGALAHPVARPAPRPVPAPRLAGWPLFAVAVAILVSLPLLAVFANLFASSDGVWGHLAATVLPRYVENSLWLALGVGAGTLFVGTGTAWLVTMYRFPGWRTFEWALLLPLAAPGYVMAYAYADFLQFVGPVQTALRNAMGWERGDYWFPEIRSVGGAVFVLTLAAYPYVYLLARSAFLAQSVCVLEASRMLGCSPARMFWKVALPLARPALVAGVALALMETLAEFGAVQHFGIDTFTTGIYRTWFALGTPVAAAQLSVLLVGFVLLLVVVERWSRGGMRFHHTTARYRRLPVQRLGAAGGTVALLCCVLPIALGFLVPGGVLLDMAIDGGDPLLGRQFLGFARNSLLLGAMAAALVVVVATLLAYAQRLARGPIVTIAVRVATLGYAMPGAVVAVGVLIAFGALDSALDGWMRRSFGVSSGLLFSGTAFALLMAYLVRFLAVAFNTAEASLAKVTPHIDQAARVLGQGPRGTLWRVHVPMLKGGLLTGALLVFVDVMKELPATLIVRPFDFDTLAIRAYRLASDERLAEASTASLAIVVVGILPVVLLSRAIGRTRPGA